MPFRAQQLRFETDSVAYEAYRGSETSSTENGQQQQKAALGKETATKAEHRE
jgi:hypothetical protein